MNNRSLIIFSGIVIGVILILSTYMSTGPYKMTESHTVQRDISRQLPFPSKAVFNQAKVESLTITTEDSPTNDSDKTKGMNTNLETIKAEYRLKFKELQAQTNKDIQALLTQAETDYRAAVTQNEKASLVSFYQRYAKAGQKIEEKTENEFHSIYDQLLTDLAKIGASEEEALEFLEEYETAKDKRKSEILQKAITIVS
ncbi:hypothetical protein [Bacillus weihaiensis]|uniref:Uncharacterized protein n=1 Tax=Bacillus weihaiensis TaxID=1547283 RepID=A0A1L3MMH1_9BACI|nr:hypothetical protein [Bacillus weihaiensis]APH03545.1 hypothetical protein A9C19_01575 [Bacillus weihaiensis]